MTEATRSPLLEAPLPVRSLGTVVPENAIRFLGHDRHEHEVPHLIYVAAGHAELVADGVPLTLRRYEAAWLAPRVPHSVRVWQHGVVLGPLLEPDVVPSPRVRVLRAVPAIVEVMTAVLGAAPANEEQVTPFRASLGAILRRIGAEYFTVTFPTHPVAAALAREAVRAPDTLVQLARRHRMSSRQVQRVFLDETGLPFARWRSRARMNAAVSAIAGGGDLTAAARSAGYGTRAGLVRALSRETGIPVEALNRDPASALAAAPARPDAGPTDPPAPRQDWSPDA